MRTKLAWVAAGLASAAGCAGSASTWRSADARPAPAAVRRLLQGIEDDISAASHRYPELSRWHLLRTRSMGFFYEFRCKEVRLGKGYLRFGKHGCRLSVSVFRPVSEPGPRQLRVPPIPGELISIREPIPDLDLVVSAHLMTGETTSDGFVEEIRRIFTECMSALKEKGADPLTSPAPHAL